MQFQVRALNAHQQIVSLVLEAHDEADARQQLAQRDLSLVSCTAAGQALLARRSPRFSLLLFTQEFHALLVAGLSVIEALDVLIDKEAAGPARAVLTRLAVHVGEGRRLSSALAQQPGVFPPLLVGIVQSAESTSDLPRAVARYIGYETRLDALRSKVVSATIYPAILMVVGGGVAAFLLGYVVPRFATVFQGSRHPLPWATQRLLDWGQYAGAHTAPLLIGALAVVCGVAWWALRHIRSGAWWQLLAVIPGTRPRLELLELSRLYLTLGMLLEGGLPITSALNLAGSVLPPGRRGQIEGVKRHIEQGGSLSAGLTEHRLITPVALRLVKVGERSGQLGTMLTRTAEFYEGDIARWMERYTRTFEPVLMAAIGVVIGLIVILLYMPIFELAGSIQ